VVTSRTLSSLSWTPKQLDRDDLYKIGVNSVVSFPGHGVTLYGDKTLLDRPSAFDRINVRRLFIVLEKTVARLAQAQLFEFNDEFTRSQFRNIVEPYLRDVKSRRGVVDYRVVCDESNNGTAVIEQNRFVGDIFVKPARSINFIQLNFVAVRNGVSFQEVAGVQN
jgi:phage tail sheath protein FI